MCTRAEKAHYDKFQTTRQSRFRSKQDWWICELIINHGLNNGSAIVGQNKNFPQQYYEMSQRKPFRLKSNTVAVCINNCNSAECEKVLSKLK